jgi:uncharacterized membrane protein YcaP (DUF421 family)
MPTFGYLPVQNREPGTARFARRALCYLITCYLALDRAHVEESCGAPCCRRFLKSSRIAEDWLDDFFRSVLGVDLDSKDIDVLQMALRAVIVYVVTICVVRMGKRRFMGGATIFDVILGIIVGSIASRAITGNSPLLPAVGAIAVLVGLHWSFSAIAVRSKSFGNLIKGTSDVVIRDGQIDYDHLRKAHMSDGDLEEDLRSAGVADVRDVLEARLERSGELSVIKKKMPLQGTSALGA